MRPDRAEDFEIKAGELGERGARVTAVSISLKGVSKRYRAGPGVHDVSLEARRGEILALVGPSGSGKTTLLRLIAGLESADAGTVLFDDEDMTRAPPAARKVGFVFQHYALFRHMSVFKNVAFGLDVKPRAERPAAAERSRIVQSLLDLVGLPDLGARRPAQLSGGQRQRVALARALAVSPRLLLLDEPFGALDVLVRKTLRRELRRIHAATGVTTVFVTHDQEEALELADQIIILNNGRIEQAGSPLEVLATPATAFVAGFLGEANAIPGKVVQGVFHGLGGRLDAPGVKDGPATAYVRPENLELAGGDEPSVETRLLRVAPRAGSVFLECAAPEGLTLEALAPASHVVEAFRIGDVVRLALRRGHVFTTAL